MALSDERIDDLAQNYGLDWLDYEPFARAIEAEARKQDDALIQQMQDALQEALELLDLLSPLECDTTRKARKAINAASARLEGKP